MSLKLAKRYALALFEASKDKSDLIVEELIKVDEIVFKNNEIKMFFLHPTVSKEAKKDVLKQAFEDKIEQIAYNFLLTLINQNRFEIFEEILYCYKELINEKDNKKKVELVFAFEINQDLKNRIQEKLEQKLNKKLIVESKIDKEIIGGFVVKFDDRIIDFSLKKEFEDLKHA